MALPIDQQPSQVGTYEKILTIANRIMNGGEITKEEAQAADFVIIASDQKIVGMDRFEGKKVIRVDINICIKAPEAVLKKCVAAVSK